MMQVGVRKQLAYAGSATYSSKEEGSSIATICDTKKFLQEGYIRKSCKKNLPQLATPFYFYDIPPVLMFIVIEFIGSCCTRELVRMRT